MEKQIIKLHNKKLSNRQICKQLNLKKDWLESFLSKRGLKSNRFQSINKINDKEAICSICNKIKSLNEFSWGRRGRKYEYQFSYCNECKKVKSYLNLNSDINKRLNNIFTKLKNRCKKQNIECNISKEEFIQLYNKQKGKCYYTKEKLNVLVGEGLKRNALSIDRIVSNKGYNRYNIVFCTHKVNTIKCDLSLEELKKWIPKWYIKTTKVLNLWDEILGSMK